MSETIPPEEQPGPRRRPRKPKPAPEPQPQPQGPLIYQYTYAELYEHMERIKSMVSAVFTSELYQKMPKGHVSFDDIPTLVDVMQRTIVVEAMKAGALSWKDS